MPDQIPVENEAIPATKWNKIPKPEGWWGWVQLFFVYPPAAAALATVIGAIWGLSGTSISLTDFLDAPRLKAQHVIAERNFECMALVQGVKHVKTANGVRVAVVACPNTGDVMVRGEAPDITKSRTTWIAADSLVDTRIAETAFSVIGYVQAEPLTPQHNYQQQVMCQRWVGKGMLLQRIATPQGCFDVVINTYYGNVVSSSPAPCDPSC